MNSKQIVTWKWNKYEVVCVKLGVAFLSACYFWEIFHQ